MVFELHKVVELLGSQCLRGAVYFKGPIHMRKLSGYMVPVRFWSRLINLLKMGLNKLFSLLG